MMMKELFPFHVWATAKTALNPTGYPREIECEMAALDVDGPQLAPGQSAHKSADGRLEQGRARIQRMATTLALTFSAFSWKGCGKEPSRIAR